MVSLDNGPRTETCEQRLCKQIKDRPRLRLCYDCILIIAVTGLVHSW